MIDVDTAKAKRILPISRTLTTSYEFDSFESARRWVDRVAELAREGTTRFEVEVHGNMVDLSIDRPLAELSDDEDELLKRIEALG